MGEGRSQGNHRTLTAEARAFVRGVHEMTPELSLQQMVDRLEKSLGIRADPSTVSRFLSAASLRIQWPRPSEVETIETSCGGLRDYRRAALHLGWVRHTAELVVRERRAVSLKPQLIGMSESGAIAKDATLKGSSREPTTAERSSVYRTLRRCRTSASRRTIRA